MLGKMRRPRNRLATNTLDSLPAGPALRWSRSRDAHAIDVYEPLVVVCDRICVLAAAQPRSSAAFRALITSAESSGGGKERDAKFEVVMVLHKTKASIVKLSQHTH